MAAELANSHYWSASCGFLEPVRSRSYVRATQEGVVPWLTCSTTERASAIRSMVNRNLAQLPRTYADKLALRLGHEWESAYFEL